MRNDRIAKKNDPNPSIHKKQNKRKKKKEKEIGKIKLNIKIIFKAIYGFKRKRNRLIKI